MARTWTSSQPSSPHWSRICLVACTISGTVAYSYFVMAATLAPDRTGASVAAVSDDGQTDILFRTARPPDRTQVTGPAQTDVYDVWEPATDRARGVTVALVHGGFWREEYDRAHLGPLAEALSRDGFHVANLEYPRAGMPGGGWPGTGEAVLAHLEAVHADTKLPDRVVVVGHSAGGHLALWLASGDRAPWVTGVVALAPAADLLEVDRLGLSDDAARALLGGTPEEHPQA